MRLKPQTTNKGESKMKKKNTNSINTNTNEVNNNEEKETTMNANNLSIFELMKMIDHNTKKIARMSQKIDKLQNMNEDLKTQLKSKIENI